MAESSVAPHPFNTGIYEIVNTVNGKRYVGSAVTIKGRFAVHRHGLRSGRHHCAPLQRAWDKYGECAFQFRPLTACAREDLLEYEQRAIDELRPEYNICRIAGNAFGTKWSDEARERARERNTLRNPFQGRKHSPETIAKMVAAATGRVSPTKGRIRSADAVARTAAAHVGMKRFG